MNDDLFDRLTRDDVQAPHGLKQDILRQIQPKSDLTSWFQATIWRPIYATALPLVFGFAVGAYTPTETSATEFDDLLLAENQIESIFQDLEGLRLEAFDE